MIKNKILVILLITILSISFSCTKKDREIKDAARERTDASETRDDTLDEMNPIDAKEIESIINKLSNNSVKPSSKKIEKAEYSIKNQYKTEELVFKDFDTLVYKNKTIGVISTKSVKMYSDITAKTVICEVERGSIVNILETVKNSSQKDEGLEGAYNFQSEYNFWYKAQFEGKNGYIFGSYIILKDNNLFGEAWGKGRQNKDNLYNMLKLSYLYKKGIKSEDFYKYSGQFNLPDNISAKLKNDRIVLENVKEKYDLSVENPDDMISLYKSNDSDLSLTPFITTDLYVHSLHLLFDRMLQDTEVNTMLPILKDFTEKSLVKIMEYEQNAKDEKAKIHYTNVKNYFLVSYKILSKLPEKFNKDKNELIEKASGEKIIQNEIDLIEKAEGIAESPLFGYKEDYSQFIPRGHYTKNEGLKIYFKTMVWFGRLHFYCDLNEKLKSKSLKLTPMTLVITKLMKEDRNLFLYWRALFEPITYLVGESDDYNVEQMLKVSQYIDFNKFEEFITDEKNIIEFIGKTDKNLAFPKISGNTLDQDRDKIVDTTEAPRGFRLFGQRFTFDSFIHNRLSSPKVNKRLMVKGADIFGVMGNKFAYSLLKDDIEKYPDYKPNFDSLVKNISGFKDSDWKSTFYNSYLALIKDLTTFDSSKPFYFTYNSSWDKKSLLTSSAAWAELRHDTILYVKQSASENMGKGPGFTWVVDNIKRPAAYIEPNLDVMYRLSDLLNESIAILSGNGFMKKEYRAKFEQFKEIVDKSVEIVKNEASDKPLNDWQNDFIYSIASSLGHIVLPPGNIGWLQAKDLQMALVSDVHTDTENQVCLEVATGKPYRIFVALNDGYGGKRIAEGFTYSYYEFIQPAGDRLNDDKWKERVYDKNDVDKLKPEWVNDILVK